MKYTKELLEPLVKESTSLAQVITKLGLRLTGGNYTNIRNRINQHNIDTSHFTGQAHGRGNWNRLHWSKVLIKTIHGRRTEASRLRRALVESGRPYQCEICGNIGIWMQKKLTLHVDHIDGNFNNNQPKNIRFLCPNCHTQTDNWGKNK